MRHKIFYFSLTCSEYVELLPCVDCASPDAIACVTKAVLKIAKASIDVPVVSLYSIPQYPSSVLHKTNYLSK